MSLHHPVDKVTIQMTFEKLTKQKLKLASHGTALASGGGNHVFNAGNWGEVARTTHTTSPGVEHVLAAPYGVKSTTNETYIYEKSPTKETYFMGNWGAVSRAAFATSASARARAHTHTHTRTHTHTHTHTHEHTHTHTHTHGCITRTRTYTYTHTQTHTHTHTEAPSVHTHARVQ